MSDLVGSVPYVNGFPLTHHLKNVRYAVPSALPAMLESGEVSAILVSSYYALTTPGARMMSGVCIGSDGPVKSVRLFSKIPFRGIQSLAFDSSSMTSNRLAQIILKDFYRSVPRVVTRPPSLEEMLTDCDAAVLIGDIGMKADGAGLHVLDLGDAWFRLTQLPFVWAGWVGNENLTPALAGELLQARQLSGVSQEFLPSPQAIETFEAAAAQSGWSVEEVQSYFTHNVLYDFGPREEAGLREFQARLSQFVSRDSLAFPELVYPAKAAKI